MVVIDNITYLDLNETLLELDISKPWFYKHAQPQLQVYRFGGKRKPFYKKADVLALKRGTVQGKQAPIVISGLLRDWTSHVRALGFQIDTVNREIAIVATPDNPFGMAKDRQFVKRSRISFVNQTPICIWTSFYPLEFVQGAILEAMKQDGELDVVNAIKEKHGAVIAWATDRYRARLASRDEQELLQLHDPEPILQLQRVSFTKEKKLVLYSDMALLGSWFAPEHSYSVDIW